LELTLTIFLESSPEIALLAQLALLSMSYGPFFNGK
jgi:hypothetical protein